MEDCRSQAHRPMTVEEVFVDHMRRRAGILKALTLDFEDFYRQCDPEKDDLCLSGLPDGSWALHLPAEKVPPDAPQPVVGINFVRDRMPRSDWISFIAYHSHAWLHSITHFYVVNGKFSKSAKASIFHMINVYPPVYEIVPESVEIRANRECTRKQSVKRTETLLPKEEDDNNYNTIPCALCGKTNSLPDGFWIACDVCEKWFHGNCVKIDEAESKYIKCYKCPYCVSKKAL